MKEKKKSKLKLIIGSIITIVAIAAIGVKLYFTFGVRVVYGPEALENIDPNSKRPVEVRYSDEDIAAMSPEERKEFAEQLGIPEDELGKKE